MNHNDKNGTNSVLMGLRIAFPVLQLILSAAFVFFVWQTQMIPDRYVMAAGCVFAILLIFTVAVSSMKNRFWGIGTVLCLVICIVVGGAYFYVNKALNLLEQSRQSYNTSDMVVMVREDSKAENLYDAADYLFGVQTGVDKANTELMLEDIRKELGEDIQVREYSTLLDMAQALLKGEVGAVVYNNSYYGLIADAVENFDTKAREIYRYGIHTELVVEEVEVGEPFNILLSGVDTRNEQIENSLSDVNIIATINPKTKKVILTTTPRDYYVTLPGISGMQRDKLTHAGIYGVEASKAAIENLYNVDISYYVRVNFNTTWRVVDALGGLDIYVEKDFIPFTDSEISFQKGWSHLDGRHVLAYVRERYAFDDGDNARGRNQEIVLSALIDKAMSPAMITNANQLLTKLAGTFETDLPDEKISELINQQLMDSTPWKVYRQGAGVGTGDSQPTYSGGSQPLYVTWPDFESCKRCSARIRMIFDEQPEDDKAEDKDEENAVK